MKLELKHLAGYLPYGLGTKYWLSKVVNIDQFKDELRDKKLTAANCDFVLQFCKPILRPLSDLTKEIEVNGEKFLPIEEYKGRYLGDRLDECINASPSDLKYAQFHVIEKLLEWHFDVYGLIDAGLAIDINTLKK